MTKIIDLQVHKTEDTILVARAIKFECDSIKNDSCDRNPYRDEIKCRPNGTELWNRVERMVQLAMELEI